MADSEHLFSSIGWPWFRLPSPSPCCSIFWAPFGMSRVASHAYAWGLLDTRKEKVDLDKGDGWEDSWRKWLGKAQTGRNHYDG